VAAEGAGVPSAEAAGVVATGDDATWPMFGRAGTVQAISNPVPDTMTAPSHDNAARRFMGLPDKKVCSCIDNIVPRALTSKTVSYQCTAS